MRSAWVRRDPMAPRYPTSVASAALMAGTSNLGSWVSTQTASRGPRLAPTSARCLSGQATTTSSAIGKRARVANTGRASQTVTR